MRVHPTFASTLTCLAWIAAGSAHAQAPAPFGEIVVLGSLAPRPAEQIGSALTVISGADLQARGTVLVSDVLREAPGVSVNRTGPQGALTQVRIRGAEANQTLVLIDGVEASDPVSGEFNFANLMAADVARIEVIRGPQSALYGSEAIGGVIAIETQDPGAGFAAEAEAGSFGTLRGFAAADIGDRSAGLRGAVQLRHTDGVSASPTGPEDDGFTNLTASLKGRFAPSPAAAIETVLRYVDSEADSDAQEFAFGLVQDAENTLEAEDLLAKIGIAGSLFSGRLTPRAHLAYSRSESLTLTRGARTGASEGERLDYGIQASGGLTRGAVDHGLTVAAQREDLSFRNESPFIVGGVNRQDDAQTSLIGEYTMDVQERLFLSAAVRQDFNDVFEDAATVRVSGAYIVRASGTRLHASWGEGITDPTFSERFGFDPGAFIGNPNLRPERSEGFDIGVEQRLFGGAALIDVTYFDADLDDEIATVFDATTFLATPVNLRARSERSGVEASLSSALGGGFALNAHYTYLDAIGGDGLAEVRRPQHTASGTVTWTAADEGAALSLTAIYNGETEDSFFGFADPRFTPRRTLEAYTLVNISGRYRLTPGIEAFARAENIADETYQEVLGFASVGAAGFVGLRVAR